MSQEIPRISQETDTRIQESFEDRKTRCWNNILDRVAPSLIGTPTPRGYVTTALTCTFENEDLNTRLSKLDKINPKDNDVFAARSILYTAYLSATDNPALEGVEQNFLISTLDQAPKITILGINNIYIHASEGGVVLVPEISSNSKAWDNFYRLTQILGLEGANLILKYFPNTITKLTSDRQNSMPDEIRDSIDQINWSNGLNTLLDATYGGASDDEIRELSIQAILSNPTYNNLSKSAKILASEYITKNLPTIDQEGLLDSVHKNKRSPEQNEIIADITDASELLSVSYSQLAKSIYESIGLRSLCHKIISKYPDDPELGRDILTTITTITKLNRELGVRYNQNFTGNQCVTNPTLTTIQNEMISLGFISPNSSIVEVTDAITSHELLHSLFNVKRARQPVDPKNDIRYLETDEILIEAINIVLGYRSTVEVCKYYLESKDEIEIHAEKIKDLSPTTAEDLINRYLKTTYLPYSTKANIITRILNKRLNRKNLPN